MKRIGIGLSDFKELIEEDFYYFDKTKFIDEIIQDGAKVKLFTRPRRFGKTLNMSMLKYFFDVEKKEMILDEKIIQNFELLKSKILYYKKSDSLVLITKHNSSDNTLLNELEFLVSKLKKIIKSDFSI